MTVTVQSSKYRKMEKTDNKETYRNTFLNARSKGKTKAVRIKPEQHARLTKIARIVCGGKLPVSAFLGNMLEEHFRTHGEELKSLYEEALLKNMEL